MNIQAVAKTITEPTKMKVPAKWENSGVASDAVKLGIGAKSSSNSESKDIASLNSGTSMQELREAVEDVQKSIHVLNKKIAIKIDEDTETPVVQFIDRNSGEVIRQLPPEDLLKLRASFKDMLKGLFFNREA